MTKLREGCLILPMRARSGKATDDFRAGLITRMIAAFGGVTVTDGQGYWRDRDGATVREPVKVLTVAYDETSGRGNSSMQDFAAEIGKALDQDAVYIRYSDGEVCLLERAQWQALTS